MNDGMPDTRALVRGAIRNWADRGWLRRLDAALAEFVAEVSPGADGTVLLGAALVAHLEGSGHTCLVVEALLEEPERLLNWPPEAIDALRFVLGRLPPDAAGWTAAVSACDAVFVADGGPDHGHGEPLVLGEGRFYLRRYWRHERRIVDRVLERCADDVPLDDGLARSLIEQLFAQRTADAGPDWQRFAAATALRSRLSIVTGGPGTGKTHTAARILALAFATSPDPSALRIGLAAPTGKAAARLKQSIDAAFAEIDARLGGSLPVRSWAARIGAARTLHALLGTRRDSRRFRHDAAHPLVIDWLIVDEASMVHVEMMDALLDALPATARLVLLGDKDQLASVEAGAMLGELCRDAVPARYWPATVARLQAATGGQVPAAEQDPEGPPLAQRIVALRHSERFDGAIDALARAVNEGRDADADALITGGDRAIAWLDAASPADVVELACRGRAGAAGYGAFVEWLRRAPESLFVEDHEDWVRGVLAAFGRFRVLCALRDGDWGVAGLNRAIERRFVADGLLPAGDPWYPGRPVIVGRNDYDAGVFNGDVGVALPAGPNDTRLRVYFSDGGALRSIGASRIADVETAFAMTVHKAQGSEFAHTALVLPPEAGRAVTRELLYTGITRARETFTLAGSARQTFRDGIAQTTRRSSGIAAMLARGSVFPRSP